MLSILAKKRYWFEFVAALTEKEIKARYKHAFLGFLWMLINPLLQMVVIGFIFQFFVPVEVDNYFLFLFAGLLPWNFFSYSITKNTPMIINERDLIQKAKFPREGIILSIVFSNLFHFLISMGLLMIALMLDKLVFDHYGLIEFVLYTWRMLLVVPLIIWVNFLTSGFSLLFSALNVRFRDVNFMIQAVMPLWFYATPIVYTLDLLPTFLRPIFYLNPMVGIVELFHYALMGIQPYDYSLIAISFLVSVLAVWVGWRVFRKESKNFDDWV